MAIGRLPGLIYGQTERGLAVNLYAASEATAEVAGTPVRIAQDTLYPFSGGVTIRIDPERPVRFSLTYRIPSWAVDPPTIRVNGESMKAGVAVDREWKTGDRVRIEFPMRATVLEDDFNNIPRVALRKGPLLYAATWEDELPVRKATGGESILSSRSHYEQWPYVPSLLAGDNLDGAFRASGENQYTAQGLTAYVRGDKASSRRLALRYVPFLSAVEGKYSVWLPVRSV
jgi:DUF1680 family protein